MPQKAQSVWYEKCGASLRKQILKEMTQQYDEAHKKEFYNPIKRLTHIDEKVDDYRRKVQSQEDDFI